MKIIKSTISFTILFLFFSLGIVFAQNEINFLQLSLQVQDNLEIILFKKDFSMDNLDSRAIYKNTNLVYQKNELFDKNLEESSVVEENILKISWQAEFFHPWSEGVAQGRFLLEENLNWDWLQGDNSLIGQTSIESCPIALEYFIEDGILKAKVSFTNKTEYPVENLIYKFIIKYPSEFNFQEEKLIFSKDGYQQEITVVSDIFEQNLNHLYQGSIESAIQYSFEAGNINSGENSQIIINLFYDYD